MHSPTATGEGSSSTGLPAGCAARLAVCQCSGVCMSASCVSVSEEAKAQRG